MADFELVSEYKPMGDQPEAIAALTDGVRRGNRYQTLQGVTGSGKTFTMANVIKNIGRPTLVISHNKTLAAQLFQELKAFFPNNAVEYFVSYYDYYQPEAYIPQTDTFIEKDAVVNKQIERYRLSAANSLLTRTDVIVVASVSCIYGIGDPEDYSGLTIHLERGMEISREKLLERLIELQYERNDIASESGMFRAIGDTVDILPSHREDGIRISFFGDEIDEIKRFDPVSMKTIEHLERTIISPARQFVMPQEKVNDALASIEEELQSRLVYFKEHGKLLELQRLAERTHYDLQMLRELGYCQGIENYSRHFGHRAPGTPPSCLIDYFPKDFLTIIDESHVSLPQLCAMYNGDQARKTRLVDYGFRLPSAKDNRPLEFNEFSEKIGQVIFLSATPGPYEIEQSSAIVKQIIRPTGLLDPPVEIRPLATQIDDIIEEIRHTAEAGDRTLVTTLTKRTAEDLSQYLTEAGLKVEYLHSGIDAIERVAILKRLRKGSFDCLVGINLLREGLDLPEVALVAVLDADKEGFLRSSTSLIQTAGRAARHLHGRVILYADTITDSMKMMIDETNERRAKQQAFNEEHHITPKSIHRAISESLELEDEAKKLSRNLSNIGEFQKENDDLDILDVISQLNNEMLEAAEALEFERAADLRDQIRILKSSLK